MRLNLVSHEMKLTKTDEEETIITFVTVYSREAVSRTIVITETSEDITTKTPITLQVVPVSHENLCLQ